MLKEALVLRPLYLPCFSSLCFSSLVNEFWVTEQTELANKTLSLFRLSDVDDYNPIMFAVCNLWFLWSISYWNSYYIPIHFFMHMQLLNVWKCIKKKVITYILQITCKYIQRIPKTKADKSIFYFGLFIFHLSSSLNCILVQFTVCEGWVEFHIVIKIEVCEKVYYRRSR